MYNFHPKRETSKPKEQTAVRVRAPSARPNDTQGSSSSEEDNKNDVFSDSELESEAYQKHI